MSCPVRPSCRCSCPADRPGQRNRDTCNLGLHSAAPCFALQVIADVLAEYGNNIDAAIKHLNDLRLSGAQGNQRGEAGLGTAVAQAAQHQAAQQQAVQQQQQQQQPQQQQPEQRHAAAAREPAGAAEPAGGAAPPAKSAAEWVDLVVQQMAEATSVADAKQRAANILQAFEQAAVQHAKQVRAVLVFCRGCCWL